MMSFKRHFGHLRDHLLAILAPLDRDSADLEELTNQLADDLLSQLEEPGILSGVFETVNQCLTWIQQSTGSGRSKGRGSGDEGEEEDEEDRIDKVNTCTFTR